MVASARCLLPPTPKEKHQKRVLLIEEKNSTLIVTYLEERAYKMGKWGKQEREKATHPASERKNQRKIQMIETTAA